MLLKRLTILSIFLYATQSSAINIDFVAETATHILFHQENDNRLLARPKSKILLKRAVMTSPRAETIGVELRAEENLVLPDNIEALRAEQKWVLTRIPLTAGQKSCMVASSLNSKFLRVQRVVDSVGRPLDNPAMSVCLFYISLQQGEEKEALIAKLADEAKLGVLIQRDILPITLSLFEIKQSSIPLQHYKDSLKEFFSLKAKALTAFETQFALGYSMAKTSETSQLYLTLSREVQTQFNNFLQSNLLVQQKDSSFIIRENETASEYKYGVRTFVEEKKYEF